MSKSAKVADCLKNGPLRSVKYCNYQLACQNSFFTSVRVSCRFWRRPCLSAILAVCWVNYFGSSIGMSVLTPRIDNVIAKILLTMEPNLRRTAIFAYFDITLQVEAVLVVRHEYYNNTVSMWCCYLVTVVPQWLLHCLETKHAELHWPAYRPQHFCNVWLFTKR